MPADKTTALILTEYEQMGEDQVRLWLRSTSDEGGSSLHKLRRRVAIEWLARFDQEARVFSEASISESLEVAKSAKDAAWAAAAAARSAALEAKTANTIATIALIGAAVAIAVSIVSTFLH